MSIPRWRLAWWLFRFDICTNTNVSVNTDASTNKDPAEANDTAARFGWLMLPVNGNTQQQAYDRGSSIFSPDGRLYQVEYAREAVQRGAPCVGIKTCDSVILLGYRDLWSPLLYPRSIKKLHTIDEHIGLASSGLAADARKLADFARREAQAHRLRYSESISPEMLTKSITDHMQQYTQQGGSRPYGVSLLIAGNGAGEAELFEADPAGRPQQWMGLAVGHDQESIQSVLEEHYETDCSHEEGIQLGLRAIVEAVEKSPVPEAIQVGVVDSESGQFTKLPTKEYEEKVNKIAS